MSEEGRHIRFEFDVEGGNFVTAGKASEAIKSNLKMLGLPPALIRRAAIVMYEGEINMVIHANGGKAIVEVSDKDISISLKDTGPGIPDIELAMQEGFSTAPDEIRSLGFGAGMGLPNMKKYSDFMEILSEVGKGTTVNMKINLL
jgi:anti-sigma regulatory factor (Ser/Thr protein kinase)